MSAFFPILLIGALASTALAADNRGEIRKAVDAPTPVEKSHGETPGVGAYLIGAVADIGGEPDTALAGYLRALAEDPDNMDLRQRSFELAMMAGDVDNAVRLARTMDSMEQTTMTRLVQMAALAHEGKVDDARKMADEVSKVSPELLQFKLFRAYLDYADGVKVEAVIANLERDELPASMHGRRNYHIARLWLKAGQPEKALTALKAAHAMEPGAVASTLLLGQVLAQQGQAEAGAVVYDTFRAENPAVALLVPEGRVLLAGEVPAFSSTLDDDVSATVSDFGLLVWAQGAPGPARQILNLSLWLNPNDVYTRYYIGMLLEMGGDSAGARQQYQRLLAADNVPDGVKLSAEIRLAEVRFRDGDEDAAWGIVKKLAEKHPDLASLQRSLAQMALQREDYGRAIKAYTRLLEMGAMHTKPEARAELLFTRGAAYERKGDIAAATEDLQAALALAPTNAQILNYLGYMWVDKGMRIEEAFKLLQKAHLLEPHDGAITDSLGWAYYRQGDYATAVLYLVRATEQDPESPEIFDHLGDAYAKLKRMEDARREWQRALDLLEAGREGPHDDFERNVRRKLK